LDFELFKKVFFPFREVNKREQEKDSELEQKNEELLNITDKKQSN